MRDLVVERSNGDLISNQVCVSLVKGSPGVVYGPSGYSTAGGTTPCIAGQTYPIAGLDQGLRIQVTVARPGRIEVVVFPDITFTMSSKATAKSESDT